MELKCFTCSRLVGENGRTCGGCKLVSFCCGECATSDRVHKDKCKAIVPAHPGIANIVNTCYVAASLQLLYHLRPLRDYFRTGQHTKEINVANRMGHQGRIARCYASMVSTMLVANRSEVSPESFMREFSAVNTTFENVYQQHDAHEFLSALLDGLHEDLNRVQDKPYVPMDAQKSGESLSECAERFSHLFRKRDDSAIFDMFAGSYISTVRCLTCDYSAASFERFNVLQLPVPHEPRRLIACRYFPQPLGKQVVDVWLGVPAVFTVRALYSLVAHLVHAPKESIIIGVPSGDHTRIVEVLENTADSVPDLEVQTVGFYQQLVRKKPADLLREDLETIYVYDLETRGDVVVHASLSFPEAAPSSRLDELDSPLQWKAGVPFLLRLPRQGLSTRAVESAVAKIVSNVEDRGLRCHSVTDARLGVEELHSKFSRQVLRHKVDALRLSRPSKADADSFRSCDSDEHAIIFSLLSGLDGGVCLECARPGCAGCVVQPSSNVAKIPEAMDDAYRLGGDALGRVRDQLTCKVRLDSRHVLPTFPVEQPTRESSLTLSDLKALACEEDLLTGDDAWRCDNCNEKVATIKSHDVWSVGDIVLIQLKRFSHGSLGEKNLRRVALPDEEFHLKTADGVDHRYRLKGVICHMGTLDRGHYTALCEDDGVWRFFDDEHALEQRSFDDQTQCLDNAYIFAFEKV